MDSITPRRMFRSFITSPIFFSGVITSNFIIGSRVMLLALFRASATARDAAALKATSVDLAESNEPPVIVALRYIRGYPAIGPDNKLLLMLSWINGRNCLGIFSRI